MTSTAAEPRVVLLAGDRFVKNALLREHIDAAIDARHRLTFRTLDLPWPDVPFGPVTEVDEASDVEDELVELVADAEIIITQMAPITSRVLAAAPSLRLVVCVRGGPVNVNVDAAVARGVTVCNAPGRNAAAAAEHTLTLMLSMVRSVPAVHAGVARGEWRSDLYAYDACGPELGSATVGLVGFGAIGSRVAAVLRALGTRVLVHDPYLSPGDLPDGLDLVDLDTVLRNSDIVSLHARLTAETTTMIDRKAIATMRPGSYLVNTARGGLLDYDALAEAMETGHLAGAGLDVYPAEPIPPGWPLLSSERVVLTPHLAGATRQTAHRAAELGAAALTAYLGGAPIPGVVGPT